MSGSRRSDRQVWLSVAPTASGKMIVRVHDTELAEAVMSEHILLVDESEIVDTLISALQVEGFQVSWCSLAMEAPDDHGADLLIFDIGVADMNVFFVCLLVQLNLQVPAIFLTARKEEVDRVAGLGLGADDYVTKPFSGCACTTVDYHGPASREKSEYKLVETANLLAELIEPEMFEVGGNESGVFAEAVALFWHRLMETTDLFI